jgi:hypothetical protein
VCWGAGTINTGTDSQFGQSIAPPLSNPVAVSLGDFHTCALDDTGVVCWGADGDGQATVPALSNPVAVSAGNTHTCAVDDSGVVCWGRNLSGQTAAGAGALSFDTDLDGLLDVVEDANGNGIVDAGETDFLNPDTDGDSFTDGEELAAGTNPLDDTSFPIVADGDVTEDGQVDVKDLLRAMQILDGQYIPTQQEQDRWDVAPLVGGVPQPNQQNNVGDYLILQRKVLGEINF